MAKKYIPVNGENTIWQDGKEIGFYKDASQNFLKSIHDAGHFHLVAVEGKEEAEATEPEGEEGNEATEPKAKAGRKKKEEAEAN